VLKILNLLALAIAAGWFGSAPGWEPVVTVVGLAATFYVLERDSRRSEQRETDGLLLFDNQADATQHLVAALGVVKPATARLVGVSASKRHDLLEHLARRGWMIQLLVQHPESALNEKLRKNIGAFIEELLGSTFSHYDRLEIRLYRQSCVFRGTALDSLGIALGWYTLASAPYELLGHENPVVFGRGGTRSAQTLQSAFDRHFNHLWLHGTTEVLIVQAPPNLGVKLSRPDFGPAAELPTS
jgi:hypothetical protein